MILFGMNKLTRHGNLVLLMKQVTLEGECFHKTCFRCAHGGCTLTHSNYAALDGVLYCRVHFQQLFMEKGNYSHVLQAAAHKRTGSSTPPEPLFEESSHPPAASEEPEVVEDEEKSDEKSEEKREEKREEKEEDEEERSWRKLETWLVSIPLPHLLSVWAGSLVSSSLLSKHFLQFFFWFLCKLTWELCKCIWNLK